MFAYFPTSLTPSVNVYSPDLLKSVIFISGAAITEVSEPTAAVIPQAAGGAAVAADEPQCMINQLFYVLNSGSDQECAICLKSIRREVITACAHVYCRPCIEAVIKNEQVSA